MKHFSSLAVLAGLCMANPTHGQTVCFNSPTDYSFTYNSNLRTVEKGDFNNDGNLDLVAGISVGLNVYVVLGDGNGGFGAVTPYPVGAGTTAISGIKAYDFNGDGNLDLAVTNRSGNEVSIMMGNGAGGFGTATEMAGPASGSTGPSGVEIADINEDGFMDLVVSLQSGFGGFCVYNGAAGGTFTLGSTFPAVAAGTPGSKGVAVGDFNGDANVDVAVANNLTANIAVWLGTGTGTFGAVTNTAVGSGPYLVKAGFINNDTNLDLVVPNKTSGSFSVLIGSGTGTFSAADNYTAGSEPLCVVIGDFNEDGKQDVAVNNSIENTLYVYSNTGINTAGNRFSAPLKYFVTGIPHEMIGGDFKEDLHLDIALPPSSGTLAILARGVGDGTFLLGTPVYAGTGPNGIAQGDFNADGKKDLVVANSTSNNFSFLAGNNDGTYAAPVNFTTGTTPVGIYAVDINHDSKLDVITTNSGSNNISVFIGTGTGSFGAATNFATANLPVSLVCKDFNNDTHIDVATANSTTNNISVLLGNGAGSFGAATNFAAGTNVSDIVAGLFNADANLDLAVSNQGSNNISVLIGTGTGSFGAATNFTTANAPMSLDAADLDGDGDQDIVTANNTGNNVSVLMGNGAGTFAAAVNYATNAGPQGVVLADFNNDGDPDIATANKIAAGFTSTVSVLVNSGTGTFGTAQHYTTGINSTALVASLINNDPLLDLAVSNNSSNNISILLNGTAIITPSGSTTFCSGSTVDLVSTPADTYLWSNSATTQSISVGASGTFTVTNSNLSGTCTSTSAPVTVTVSGSGPSAPTITGTTVLCIPGSTTLTATPGSPSVDIEWYDSPTGGIKLSDNNSYTTPVLSTTTTFYVNVADTVGGCAMPSRIPVTVNVGDAIDPVISGMPSNVTQNVTAGTCGRVVTWTAPTASDNCAMGSFTSTHTSGATFPVGTTTVTYTATDLAGNDVSASFTITIVDNINPTLSGVPSNITQNVVSGCSKTVTWTAPTANDNCSATLTSTHTSGASFPVGTTTVTYTATDPSGHTATGSFTVTIVDAINPTITGTPSNITQNLVSGCTKTVTWTAPTASDNCSVSSFTASHTSGATFPVGTTTVSYTATDASGNITTTSFTVTIVDNTNPTLSGIPANINTTTAAGSCNKAVTWTAPTASDNCTVTLTSTHTSGSTFALGTTTVTYTATDASGNTATGSFTVTVTDNVNPTISGMPSNITTNATAGTCGKVVTWTSPTANDNCTVASFTSSHTSGSTFPVGTTTVTYTATDGSGNITTGSFTVTVNDNINPTISGMPSNITQTLASGCSKVVTWTAPTASDNCSVASFTSSHVSGATFPVGTTTVTYTATDASGNVTTSSFTVTINDAILPTISGMPANITQNVTAGTCGRNVSWTAPTASDNCTVTLTSTHTSGSNFPVGTTTVTYTATDASGNIATGSFTITIVDNINPTISGMPSNITQNVVSGCSKTVTWTAPTANDNCSATLTTTNAPGSSFPVGTTTVTYTATDPSGNTATGSFTVTIVDAINPTISGMPATINTTTAAGTCGKVVTWTAPTGSDNCSLASLTASHASGATFPVGTTTVTYTATDAAGNVTTSSFDINVTDNINPTISGMPSDITMPIGMGTCENVASWTAPTASDNCSVSSFTSSHTSGSTFPAGTTVVTYTATDASGNITTASFNVIIVDNINPTISGVPANITQNVAAGTCGKVVTWAAPTGNDNCSFTMTSTHASGATFPVGTTTVTYTVTDPSGNTATGSFTITIIDNINPTISGTPSNIVTNSFAASCSRTVTWVNPTASDNCSATLTTTHTSGSSFPVGVTTVTYTATDPSGNVTTSSFTVTVNDVTQPTIPTITNITQNVTSGCSKVVTYTLPTITDNCGVASVTSSHPSGSTFPVGTTTVTITATDIHGNIRTRTFTITIVDNILPVISGMPSNITQNVVSGCSKTVTWTAPTTTDNCSATLTTTNAPGSSFPVGTTTVTYTSTDASGNIATASFTVTIVDAINPTLTSVPANINANVAPGTCAATVNWTAPTANDNCSATLTTTNAPGSSFPVGITTVTYTATDPSGNTATGSFTVTVTDNINPTIAAMSNITVNTDPGVCGATVSWTDPAASDNCSVSSLTPSITSGSFFNTGTTTVTYTAVDVNGNSSTASFDVIVTDNEQPAISGTPADITVNNDSATCGAVVTWTVPTSTDNCSVTSFVGSHTPGSVFSVGTTTVSYTAMDAAGNDSTVSFNVTVTDNEIPGFSSFPGNITLNVAAGTCDSIASWTLPVGFDNCGIDTLMASDTSGSTFPVGTTTVTYILIDIHGNSIDSSFTVTVIDNEAPQVLGCPNDITQCEGTVVNYTAPTGTDNCSGTVTVTLTAGLASGSVFPVGTTVVTHELADAAGNISTCSFNVVVNANPVVTYVSPIDTVCLTHASTTLTGGSPAGGTYSGTGVLSGIFDQSIAGLGTHEIIYTFTDLNGCSSADTAEIVVDGCTGLPDVNGAQYSFSVYPNPSKGMFVLELSALPAGETTNVSVFNPLGEMVYSTQTSSDRLDVDLQNQANGVYIVKINCTGFAASKQVIVHR